jgi:hypothetical protein
MPVVRTQEDLLHLRAHARRLFLGVPDRAFEFHVPSFDPQENKRLTVLFSAYINDCGCTVGSLFLALSAAGSLAYYFLTGGTLNGVSVQHWVLLVAITLVGAMAGKFLGLAYSRLKMLRLLRHALARVDNRRITHQFHHTPSPEEELWEDSAAKPRNG